MKQTIHTDNHINATVQIPYEKLYTKNPHYPVHHHCQSQITVVPHCGCHQQSCCSSHNSYRNTNTSQMQATMVMIKELQVAYRDDVQSLNKKINELQTVLAHGKSDTQHYRNRERDYQKTIDRIKDQLHKQKQQVKNLSNTCQRLRKERESLMRAKIHEFQTAKENQKANYEEILAKMKHSHQTELQQSLKKYTDNFQLQKKKYDQLICSLNIQLERERKNISSHQQQIESHKGTLLTEKTKYNEKETGILRSVEQKDRLLSSQKAEIYSLQQQLSRLLHQVQIYESKNKGLLNQLLTLKDRQIPIYKNKIFQAEQKLQQQYRLNQEFHTHKKQANGLYETVLASKTQAISKLQAAIERIARMEEELLFLKDQKNRIYEVKIEKVIDRKQQFDCLEVQVQNLRRINVQLRSQITVLQSKICEKDQLVDELFKKHETSQGTIIELKKLIEERQKSFAWIVQREIEQDMESNIGNLSNQSKVYRVQPLKQKLADILDENARVESCPVKIKEEKEIIIVKGSQVSRS